MCVFGKAVIADAAIGGGFYSLFCDYKILLMRKSAVMMKKLYSMNEKKQSHEKAGNRFVC